MGLAVNGWGSAAAEGTKLSIKVIDGSNGTAVDGFELELEQQVDGSWQKAVKLVTDSSGIIRIGHVLAQDSYRFKVNSSAYFAGLGGMPPLASVTVTFWIPDSSRNYLVLVVIEGHMQVTTIIREDETPP
jgi:5-hydroxyisourate hydrolase-like protein (transthyretin family)